MLLTSLSCLWLRTPGSPVQTRTPSSAFFWETDTAGFRLRLCRRSLVALGQLDPPLRLSLHIRQTALTPFHTDGMRTGTELLSSEGPPGLQFFLASQTREALREPSLSRGLTKVLGAQVPLSFAWKPETGAGAVVAAHLLGVRQQ